MELPAEVGAKEVQGFLRHLEQQAATNERFLINAARQIEKEEEILDSVYSKLEELNADQRRLELVASTAREKGELLKDHYDEINQEISTIESDLPLLSEVPLQHEKPHGDSLSSRQIYQFLEVLSQKYAFLLDSYHKLEEKVEISEEDVSLVAPTKNAVDKNLLRVSEAKSKQADLEREMQELEDCIRSSMD